MYKNLNSAFMLVLALAFILGATYPSITLDSLVDESSFIVEAKVKSKVVYEKCDSNPCERIYAYKIDPLNNLKGLFKGGVFCSSFNLDDKEDYLLFLKKRDVRESSADNKCIWRSALSERNFFRIGYVDGIKVVDVQNPPAVNFPKDFVFYEARGELAKEQAWYFSVDFKQLQKFIKEHKTSTEKNDPIRES